jgi:hypothetical protein
MPGERGVNGSLHGEQTGAQPPAKSQQLGYAGWQPGSTRRRPNCTRSTVHINVVAVYRGERRALRGPELRCGGQPTGNNRPLTLAIRRAQMVCASTYVHVHTGRATSGVQLPSWLHNSCRQPGRCAPGRADQCARWAAIAGDLKLGCRERGAWRQCASSLIRWPNEGTVAGCHLAHRIAASDLSVDQLRSYLDALCRHLGKTWQLHRRHQIWMSVFSPCWLMQPRMSPTHS